MTGRPVRLAELVMPRRQRLTQAIEFGLPAIAAIISFTIAADGASWDRNMVPSTFFVLVAAYFGTALSAQNVIVRPGEFIINGLFRTKILRDFSILKMSVDNGPGSVTLHLKRNDQAQSWRIDTVVLRWAPWGIQYWRSNGELIPAMVEQAYCPEDQGDTIGTVEHRWIRWRLIYLSSLVALSPVPFLLGWLIAGPAEPSP